MNGRLALAKARLRVHAAAADARPSAAERAAGMVRGRPWRGVGLALLAGVVLGAGRRRVVRTLLGPAMAPLLAEVTWTALRGGGDLVQVKRAARAGAASDVPDAERRRS